MATYYVRKTGSDSAGGTSPATAWLTIDKSFTSSASGDTVYIGAGVYREALNMIRAFTSDTFFIGDYTGQYTGDSGEIQISNYTTNNKTAPSTALLSTTTGAASHYVFQNITFIAGTTGLYLNNGSQSSTFQTFTDCTFINASNASADGIFITQGIGQYTYNWLFDRCRFLFTISSSRYLINISALTPSTNNTDIVFTIQNCMFSGTAGSVVNAVSPGGNLPGGIVFKNNTVMGGKIVVNVGTSKWSTTTPIRVYSNMMVSNQFANSGTSGQIVEDYNHYWTNTATTNVTTGTNTKTNGAYSLMCEWGQELTVGKLLRPFGTPTIDSPSLGYGSNGSYTTTVDILNKNRPSGGAVTWATTNVGVGCYERHDYGTKDTTVYDTAPTSLKMTGPGDQYLQIPVDSTSTILNIRTRWDSSYGGGTLPTFVLLANGEIGVAAQSITATGSANTWVTVTLSFFTPTAQGVVTVGLISNSAASGTCNWDNISLGLVSVYTYTMTGALTAGGLATTPVTNAGNGGFTLSGLASARTTGTYGTVGAITLSSNSGSDASSASGGATGASTFGPLFFLTATNNSGSGSVAWTNPGNAVGSSPSDNVYATSAIGSGSSTNYLELTNPDISLAPFMTTITGFVIEIERKVSSSGPTDLTIKLIKGGSVVGNNKSGASWSTTESFVTFGAGNDLWGSTWTGSDFNSTFGVQIQATNAGSSSTCSIDSARVTVYYD
jgi:hypothetical protein